MTISASIIGSTFVTIMMDGTTYTINGDHLHYDEIRTALKNKDHATVERLVNIKQSVMAFSYGNVTVSDGEVFYRGEVVHDGVTRRILDMVREKFDAEPMLAFLNNLMLNPSKRAVDELYGFLEKNALPITEDGHFLAYKKVRDNYRDFYTGKMDNSVGQVLSMARNAVDENKDITCSYGLHFCSLEYLPHYHGGQGRVMIVKINPADVVAVPSDYNNAKGRACAYEIIGEVQGDNRESQDYFTSPVYRGTAPVVPDCKAPVSKKNPSLQGYNDGRRDASCGVSQITGDFGSFTDTADQVKYAAAYNKGMASILNKAAPREIDPLEIDPRIAFKCGYQDGSDQAERDSESYISYNDVADSGQTSDYAEGYAQGYAENYSLDWAYLGYECAQDAVNCALAYDDAPPDTCVDYDDARDYRTGYADGWREGKLSQI